MGPGAEVSLADRFTRALLSHTFLGVVSNVIIVIMGTVTNEIRTSTASVRFLAIVTVVGPVCQISRAAAAAGARASSAATE